MSDQNINNTEPSLDWEGSFIAEYQTRKFSVKELCLKYGVTSKVACNRLRKHGIEIVRRPNKYANLNENFFKILTPESIWVLGWFYSDGSVNKKTNVCSITTHTKDVELLEKIRNIMGDAAIYHRKDSMESNLKIANKAIRDDLIRLGCVPNKSLIISYPEFFTEDWQHWIFLRGILEGDGYIAVKKEENIPNFHCGITCGSLKFLQSIKQLLKDKLDIDCSIIEREDSNSKQLNILGGKENNIKFLNIIYNNGLANCYLKRKFDLYLFAKNVWENPNDPLDRAQSRWVCGHFASPDGKFYYTNCAQKLGDELGISGDALRNLANGDIQKSRSGWSKPTAEQLKTENFIAKIY